LLPADDAALEFPPVRELHLLAQPAVGAALMAGGLAEDAPDRVAAERLAGEQVAILERVADATVEAQVAELRRWLAEVGYLTRAESHLKAMESARREWATGAWPGARGR
jgi:hypothetical protein